MSTNIYLLATLLLKSKSLGISKTTLPSFKFPFPVGHLSNLSALFKRELQLSVQSRGTSRAVLRVSCECIAAAVARNPRPPEGRLVCRYCPQPAMNSGPFIDLVCSWLHCDTRKNGGCWPWTWSWTNKCVCQSPFLTVVVSSPGGIVEGN